MKNRFTFPLLFFMLTFASGIRAQDTRWDTIPKLIISEVRVRSHARCYIELANADEFPMEFALNMDFKNINF